MRRAPNKTEKLAACLLMLRRGEGWLIPEPLRSSGDAKAIVRFPEWDHATPFAWGGTTLPHNITPLHPEDHKAKTRKDVAKIAKVKRAERKRSGKKRRARAIPSRPFPSASQRKAWRAERGL